MAFRPINVGHPRLPFQTGRYYSGVIGGTAAAGIAATENRLYFTPIFIPRATRLDRVACHVSVAAGSAEYEIRMGIYRDADGIPGPLIVDAGTVATGTGTGAQEATISQTLAGWVWACVIGNRNGGASGTQATFRGPSTTSLNPFGFVAGQGTADFNTAIGTFYHDQTVASWAAYTLPATAPTLTIGATVNALTLVRAA